MVKTKAARTIAVLDAGRQVAEVLIKQGEAAQRYRVERHPARAVWQKLYAGRFYTVTLRGRLPFACTCEAGARGKPCKHLDGTKYLLGQNLLQCHS